MSANGYICPGCQQWIYPGTYHTCTPINVPIQPPQPIYLQQPTPCRAPFSALTADAVRLIVREELERILQQLQQGKSDR